MATLDTAQKSPVGVRVSRAERQQAVLLAAQSRVNPETGRLPVDQVRAFYAELAAQFGLEPSSVANYLPSSIKPTPAETLAYARSRRGTKATQRRKKRVAAKEPVAVPTEPSVAAKKEPAGLTSFGVVPAALGEALEAFAARIAAEKELEIVRLRERIAALEAENERVMAALYRLNERLSKAQAVLGIGNDSAKHVA